MALYTFASIAHPDKYGYKFDSSCYDGTSITSRKFRVFETYGDGMIQHSNDRSVSWELLTDYLQSLAAAMLTNEEMAENLAFYLSEIPNPEEIAFAASVVFKESDREWSKRRYFSLKLQKMGTRTKEHDKRFTEVREWHDGSRASMYRLLCGDALSYSEGFHLYQISESVREWADAQKKYIPVGENWPKWLAGDHNAMYSLRAALGTCRAICDAARKVRWAKGVIERYTEDVKPSFNQEVQFTRATTEEIAEVVDAANDSKV